MLKCYFVVATLFNTGTFTAGETPAPVPLQQFHNIAYEITNTYNEDFERVYRAFSYDAIDVINYPEKMTLTLQTPKDAGGVYVLIWKVPGYKADMAPFMLETVTGTQGSKTILVEGDKLIIIEVDGDKTLKAAWEFSDDQVIETLECGDAKASRVWKVQLESSPAPTPTSPAPVPLEQFDNIAYEITSHYTMEDLVRVYRAFGYDDKAIEYLYGGDSSDGEKWILILRTPKDAGGVYVRISKILGENDIYMRAFSLNKTVLRGENTFFVEGDKLMKILVNRKGTQLKIVWEFSVDQVIETVECGDAKASRVWKALKTVNSKQ